MIPERVHDTSRTKIVATIGPSCNSKDVLKSMIIAGVDVCRLNFSHGSRQDHLHVINIIREIREELRTNVAILADLQGPKIRVGDIENNNITLEKGDELEIVNKPVTGTKEKIYLAYESFPQDVSKGDIILMDDGKLKLEVISTNKSDSVMASVIYGGPLSSNKGVNLPDTTITLPSMTEKDIEDAKFALENEVDWLALSFVRSPSDIIELDQLIKKQRKSAGIIAKIEKPQALSHIDEILDLVDGIMVARGDLGVEVPYDQVPVIQKDLVKKCLKKAIPVIIATQMMESMINNFRPTRAEANDVANSVLDGADAVMLSGETAVGKHPVTVINSMQRIIDYTEPNGSFFNREDIKRNLTGHFLPDSICANANFMANQTGAKAIIIFTFSGYTALRIASYRPNTEIIVFTRNKKLLNRLPLIWGVKTFYIDDQKNIDEAIDVSIRFLKRVGLLKPGDVTVHVSSTPIHARGNTNMLKLSYA